MGNITVDDIIKNPALADNLTDEDWNKFSSEDWYELLETHPQFADKCDVYNGWGKDGIWSDLIFTPNRWRRLLAARPQLIEKAKKYPSGWVAILLDHPNLADECDRWNDFKIWYSHDRNDGRAWHQLLMNNPQLADKCDEHGAWDDFDSSHWGRLLEKQPQLWVYCPHASVENIINDTAKADECKCWDWFTSDDWGRLLEAQPQFAEKCPDEAYDLFTKDQWKRLEAINYDLFNGKHVLSSLRKL